MTNNYVLPGSDEATSYLRHTGWTQAPSSGPAGSLWMQNGARIGVPHDASDERLMRGAIERLATFERRIPERVAFAMRYQRIDVAHLRVANDLRITDTVPFETAATIVSATRLMLRAVATTSKRAQSHIGRKFARFGDQIVNDARLAHTERGSFVFPILVPLTEPAEDAPRQPHIEGMEITRLFLEPLERRVTRTFAQSLQAIRDVIIQPAQEPTSSQLHAAVERGVSRELCLAVTKILEEPAVSEFETSFDWAPIVTAPRNERTTLITLESGAAERVERAAEELRQIRIEPKQLFTGIIVELRHVPDDPYGEIGVSTVRGGRPSEVTVRLRYEEYLNAWDWHLANRTVLVEGQVRRKGGRHAIVDSPLRCHPLDDEML